MNCINFKLKRLVICCGAEKERCVLSSCCQLALQRDCSSQLIQCVHGKLNCTLVSSPSVTHNLLQCHMYIPG